MEKIGEQVMDVGKRLSACRLRRERYDGGELLRPSTEAGKAPGDERKGREAPFRWRASEGGDKVCEGSRVVGFRVCRLDPECLLVEEIGQRVKLAHALGHSLRAACDLRDGDLLHRGGQARTCVGEASLMVARMQELDRRQAAAVEEGPARPPDKLAPGAAREVLGRGAARLLCQLLLGAWSLHHASMFLRLCGNVEASSAP